MMTTLWENRHLRIWKAEGAVSGVNIDFTEPEGVDYYLKIGRDNARRGTMLGNPSFFQTYDTFYGATRYNAVDIKTKSGSILTVSNVTVVKKFKNCISEGNKGTFYMLSPKNASSGDTMMFAARTENGQSHDIDGLCSVTEMLQTGIRRQLLLVAGPAVISILFFSAVFFSFFGISFWPFIFLFLLFIAGACAAGFFLLGIVIRNSGFPSKAVFEDILRKEGMTL